MPAYKLKSLLYLLVFIFCAWIYFQTDAEASDPDNQPVAGVVDTQAEQAAQAGSGL